MKSSTYVSRGSNTPWKMKNMTFCENEGKIEDNNVKKNFFSSSAAKILPGFGGIKFNSSFYEAILKISSNMFFWVARALHFYSHALIETLISRHRLFYVHCFSISFMLTISWTYCFSHVRHKNDFRCANKKCWWKLNLHSFWTRVLNSRKCF